MNPTFQIVKSLLLALTSCLKTNYYYKGKPSRLLTWQVLHCTSYDLYYLLCLFLGRYSCTSQGTVYQIDYQKIMLDKVIRLLPIGSRNDPAKYGGTTLKEFGIRLNSLCVNDSFCATGSDDGFLRLWPLDFSTVFLEAG